jgi:hypothetical protein
LNICTKIKKDLWLWQAFLSFFILVLEKMKKREKMHKIEMLFSNNYLNY